MKSQVGMEETKEELDELQAVAGKDTLKDEEMTSQWIKSQILPIFHRIQLEKDKYFQNQTVQTEHASAICDISISSMSRFLVTSSSDSVIVWSLKSKPKKIVKIALDSADSNSKIISWIDPKGSLLFVNKKYDNKLAVYSINADEESYQTKDDIVFPKDFQKELLDSLIKDDSPFIHEMYFINEGKILRWAQYDRDKAKFADIDMETGKCTTRKAEKHEDKGVFKYGLTYVQHHDTLNEFIKRQETHKNKIKFPEKDFETWVVLETDHGKGENFLIYDVFNERISRKIFKADNPIKAFDIHHDSSFFVYAKGKSFVMYSLEIPEDIEAFIKPIYFSRDHNKNPAKIVKEKDKLCGKIMSLLKLYREKKSNKFLIRIRKMMYKCFDNPPLLSYNNAFLTLYKTLIQDDTKWDRTGIVKLHRTMVFNEIKFSNDLNKIRNVWLPSDPDSNYLLLSIDGVIHKYDISTKELLFSFKASAYRTMQIFDNDQKILTCDSTQAKIWQFDSDNPDLLTSLPFEDKVDKFYALSAKNSKSSWYYVGTFQNKNGFRVYKDKLTEHWQCRDRVTVNALDFTTDSSTILAGTQEGKLCIYDLKDGESIGEITVGKSKPVSFVNAVNARYWWVANQEPAVYILPLEAGAREMFKLDTNKSEITWMWVSKSEQIIVIGYSSSVIEFWKYYSNSQDFKLIKEIQEDFQLFDIDTLCSSMLILNPKCRDIEFFLIEWDWNTDAINKDLQSINLDFENLKAEDIIETEHVDEPKEKMNISDGKGKKRSQTACCSIF